MQIEETFNKPENEPIYPYLYDYMIKKGFDQVTPKDLNKFIDHYGTRATGINRFDTLYSIVITNHSGKIMNRLTFVIAGMTLIMTIFTVLVYYHTLK